MRSIVSVSVAAMALCALAGGCGEHEGEDKKDGDTDEVVLTAQKARQSNIIVAPVAEQDVGGAIVTIGKVTFDDLRVAHVYSPVTGRIAKIQAQPGQRVKKGAPLATLVSPDVGSAFSDLDKAQAELTAAEHDWKRQKQLFEQHAGSQKDYEVAEDNYQKAKAEQARAVQKARLLREGVSDKVSSEYTLTAPIDGEVISRTINPGAEVQGQYSQGNAVELFTIGELDQVWVLADVFESDLAKVKVGLPVTVSVVAYPKKLFEGHVEWVSDALDPVSRTAKIRCAIKNPDRELKPEMYATVSIAVAEQRKLAVPRSAVQHMGDQTVIYVQEAAGPGGEARFERRPVAVIEDEGGPYVPVTHGLEPGENIVIAGDIVAPAETAGPNLATKEASLSPQQIKDSQIQTYTVAERDVGGAIVASGKVTFDDLRVAHVFSPVTGRVTKILAQPGERVKKGAPLATLVSPDVGAAFSDLGKAQADVVAAEHEFQRTQALYEQHAGSQKDFEASEDNYKKAKAELERAEQKARLLKTGVSDQVTSEYTLRAPIDGEVIARNVNPGTEVQGQYSQGNAVELFTIGELDQVWVLADVFEVDMAQVKKGARVAIKVVAYPGKSFEGHVEWLSTTLDPNSRTAKVRCAIKNPGRELKPEMYAMVTIFVDERKAIAVPRQSILRLANERVVFVQTGETPQHALKFERRVVTVDEDQAGDYLPVTSGLKLGDIVVTNGAILLSGML